MRPGSLVTARQPTHESLICRRDCGHGTAARARLFMLSMTAADPFAALSGGDSMFLRSAAFACAAAIVAALAAPATAETARCDATNFRVYFAHGSASLTPAARETIETAARTVAGCDYAELRVALDASSPQASRRAAAI